MYSYNDGGHFDPRVATPQGPTPTPIPRQTQPIRTAGTVPLQQLVQPQPQPEQQPEPQAPPNAEYLAILAHLVGLELAGTLIFGHYSVITPGVLHQQLAQLFDDFAADCRQSSRQNARYMLLFQGRQYIPHKPLGEELEQLPEDSLDQLLARTVEFKETQLAHYTNLLNLTVGKQAAIEMFARNQVTKLTDQIIELNLMWERI